MEQLAPLPPLPDDAAIRNTADTILHGSDYVLTPQNHDSEAYILKFFEFMQRIWNGFKGWSISLYQFSPILFWLFMAVLVLIVIGLLWHTVYTLRRAFSRSDTATLAAKEIEQSDEPTLWERRATEAHTRGDRVFALRCLLMAGLLRLEAGQKKRLRRGATNREILRRYRESIAFEPLRLLVDLVDFKWYGGGQCEAADYDAGAQAYARLRAVVPSVTAAPAPPAPHLALAALRVANKEGGARAHKP